MSVKNIAKLAFVLARRAARVKRFLVAGADYIDVLNCTTAEEPFTPVWVAKPLLLRASVEDHAGVTFTYPTNYVTRTATLSGEETQVLVPSYESGDFIIAISYEEIGLYTTSYTQVDTKWIDLNVDARAWAYDPSF